GWVGKYKPANNENKKNRSNPIHSLLCTKFSNKGTGKGCLDPPGAMACLSFLVQKVAGSTQRVVVPSSVAWRRTVSLAACFSSLSGGVLSSSSRPPIGDHNEVQEFPLPLSSYPVLMLPSSDTTCRVFNPVTRQFTRITYPGGGAGGKLSSSSSFPYFSQHGWLSFVTYNDCSLILANGLLSNENPPIISLPPFHTLPNLHSLPIHAADPQLKAKAPPGTDCFFHYTSVQDGEEFKFLPRDIRRAFGVGSFMLSSAPTNDDCVGLLIPSPRLRYDLGIDFAYCRMGDTCWSTVPLPPHDDFDSDSRIDNVVYSRRDKLFYAITGGSCIQVIDFNDHDLPPKMLCSAAPDLGLEVCGDGIPSLTCWESLVESPQGLLVSMSTSWLSISRSWSQRNSTWTIPPYLLNTAAHPSLSLFAITLV
ncbi:hypothetical protein Tsubulata_039932, partial [Turnera subulata]